eukprot:COSAG04_NODE_1456_length_6639_cov_83.154281_2_plen_232_part_00
MMALPKEQRRQRATAAAAKKQQAAAISSANAAYDAELAWRKEQEAAGRALHPTDLDRPPPQDGPLGLPPAFSVVAPASALPPLSERRAEMQRRSEALLSRLGLQGRRLRQQEAGETPPQPVRAGVYLRQEVGPMLQAGLGMLDAVRPEVTCLIYCPDLSARLFTRRLLAQEPLAWLADFMREPDAPQWAEQAAEAKAETRRLGFGKTARGPGSGEYLAALRPHLQDVRASP